MERLTILVTSVTGVGHINASIGATLPLLLRGHRVVFVLESAWKGKLALLGFEEHLYTETAECKQGENPGEAMAKYLLSAKSIGSNSAEEKMKTMTTYFKSQENRNKFSRFNAAIKEAIEKYQPNVVWVDGIPLHFCEFHINIVYPFQTGGLRPAVRASGIPWIQAFSGNPAFLHIDPDLPPGGFGLPTFGGRDAWDECNKIRREIIYSSDYQEMVQKLGYERYPGDAISPIAEASLVVYGFPEELNYASIPKWFNLEIFNRPNPNQKLLSPLLTMLVPEEFMERCKSSGGKLIYVSLSTMASADLQFMNRLISLLGKTEHKYIVSKGPRHDELKLPGNMYGDRYLPQQKILPHVELVICHGGCNTVTESLAEGKPLIVLPNFGDQFDNAQRIEEVKLGIRLNYDFLDNELIDAIEKLLYDKELHSRLEAISNRLKASDKHSILADKIETMFRKQK